MAYRILTSAALVVALATPALAVDEIRPSGPAVILPINSGTLLQSPRPLTSVFIANPDIANVQIPEQGDKDLIFVLGKTAGKTTLYAVGTDGHVAVSQTVEVTGPKTVRVMRGSTSYIWSEAHEHAPNVSDLPAGSTVTMPAGAVMPATN
jgi:Flp pilus assembly secretin CpaC